MGILACSYLFVSAANAGVNEIANHAPRTRISDFPHDALEPLLWAVLAVGALGAFTALVRGAVSGCYWLADRWIEALVVHPSLRVELPPVPEQIVTPPPSRGASQDRQRRTEPSICSSRIWRDPSGRWAAIVCSGGRAGVAYGSPDPESAMEAAWANLRGLGVELPPDAFVRLLCSGAEGC